MAKAVRPITAKYVAAKFSCKQLQSLTCPVVTVESKVLPGFPTGSNDATEEERSMSSWRKTLSSLQAQVLVRCNWRLEVGYEEQLKPMAEKICNFPGPATFHSIQDLVNARVEALRQDHYAQMQAYKQKKCAEAAAAPAVAAAAEAAQHSGAVGRRSATGYEQQGHGRNGAWESSDAAYVDAMEGQGDSQ
jgi:hypothetical protein